MTSLKFAINNIKKNFSDYLVYFLSIVCSSMVFYIFISLFYNEQIARICHGSGVVIFKVSAIMVTIFISIFMWYSNSFFIKRRKKEVATYLLFGMRKKSIGTMMLIESVLMGLIAVACGIGVGILFSKLFVMILVGLMGETAQVKFVIVPKAVIATLKVFGIILLITSLHGYFIIYRFKLIELFRAEKEAEKEPKASWIIAFVSLVLVGTGYYLALTNGDARAVIFAVPILILVVTGTYGIFRSMLVKLVNLFRKNKARYYKGTNMIAASQMLYRIKGNSMTLATIAVLSASTLTAMGTVYGLYNHVEDISRQISPFSITCKANINDSKIENIINKYPMHGIKSKDTLEFLTFDTKISGLNHSNAMRFLVDFSKSYIISETQYRKALEHQGYKIPDRLDSEYDTIMIEMNIGTGNSDILKNKQAVIKVPGSSTNLTIKGTTTHNIVSAQFAGTTFVVKDSLYSKLSAKAKDKLMVTGYMINNEKDAKELSNELSKISTKNNRIDLFYPQYDESLKFFGLFLFIGIFLGLVFLLATGSIIYFKQLTDATEQKQRYKMLRDIGMGKDEIKSSIAKQLLLVFGLPLIVGILHCTVALTMTASILQVEFLFTLIMTVAIYTLIYAAYYLITLNSFVKTVSQY